MIALAVATGDATAQRPRLPERKGPDVRPPIKTPKIDPAVERAISLRKGRSSGMKLGGISEASIIVAMKTPAETAREMLADGASPYDIAALLDKVYGAMTTTSLVDVMLSVGIGLEACFDGVKRATRRCRAVARPCIPTHRRHRDDDAARRRRVSRGGASCTAGRAEAVPHECHETGE